MKAFILPIACFCLLISCMSGNQSESKQKSKKESKPVFELPWEPIPEPALESEPLRSDSDENDNGQRIEILDSLLDFGSEQQVYFTNPIHGYSISATFTPDTAYSDNVGHIEYILTDSKQKQSIKTTYNHFFGHFRSKVSKYDLTEEDCVGSIADSDRIPFRFMDVDFDGVEEFLIMHEGYNRKYYEIYKKGSDGRFSKLDIPILAGIDGDSEFDYKEKTITISENSGCSLTRTSTYKLFANDSSSIYKCIYKSEVENIGDTIQYTTWKLIGDSLTIVSQTKDPL